MAREIIIGNCLEVMRGMDVESIDCIVTSPPYWSLRDYGSEPAIWATDENKDCTHQWMPESAYCTKCRAWKGQLGLEPSLEEYISHLLMVFDEAHRVLKPSGALWVNLGDAYYSSNKQSKGVSLIRNKSLCQIPNRFAIGMTDRGWILRNEIIWHKPNVMPQPAKDRFTIDYEKLFFFTKSEKYYFEQQLEPIKEASLMRAKYGLTSAKGNLTPTDKEGLSVEEMGGRFVNPEGRNVRCVWKITPSVSRIKHTAMFPMSLIDRPIKATCPPGGIVLDPFCGSGTVLEYCFNNDLNGIGIEVNPDYKEIIEQKSKVGVRSLNRFKDE